MQLIQYFQYLMNTVTIPTINTLYFFSCWMALPAFYYSFVIPISCIILINVVIFFITIVSIFRRGKGLRSNQKKQKMAMTNLQAAITSFILLGEPESEIVKTYPSLRFCLVIILYMYKFYWLLCHGISGYVHQIMVILAETLLVHQCLIILFSDGTASEGNVVTYVDPHSSHL